MNPYLIIHAIDGDKLEYTAYIPGQEEVNGIATVGQPIDMDTGLPRVEDEEMDDES